MSLHIVPRFTRWLDDFLSARPTVERIVSAVGLVIENLVKVPLFKCQRCGECILSHTAFVCSQRCPKRLRNGGCGGTRPGGFCEVYPERRCIWFLIYSRARVLGRVAMLTEIMPGHRWDFEKTSAWLNVFRGREEPPVWSVRSVAERLDFDVASRALDEREP